MILLLRRRGPSVVRTRSTFVGVGVRSNGAGFPGPDPDQSYLADHGYQTEGDRFRRQALSLQDPEPPPPGTVWDMNTGTYVPEHLYGAEPGDAERADAWERGEDAATWGPALEAEEPASAEDRLVRDVEHLAARAEMFRGQERAALAREHLAQQDEAQYRGARSPELQALAAPKGRDRRRGTADGGDDGPGPARGRGGRLQHGRGPAGRRRTGCSERAAARADGAHVDRGRPLARGHAHLGHAASRDRAH